MRDETEQASKSFDEYYGVMVDTGKRDGFAPAPKQDYEDMIQELGPEHCDCSSAVSTARWSTGA